METTQASPDLGPAPAARNWALLAHLGPVALALLSAGILGWLVPLAVLLTQREAHPFAVGHAKESLNFRLTLVIVYGLSLPFLFVLPCLWIPIWLAIWAAEILVSIIASVRASEGKPYRYPLTLRLVS